MKISLAALLIFLCVFSFTCKEEEEKHKILKNENGTIEFETFALDNGMDSAVSYAYYANGAKKGVSIFLRKRENRGLYYYHCFYDSATGKLNNEIFLDSSDNVLRERSWRFENEWDKVVWHERFGHAPSGSECQLAWTYDGAMPLRAEFEGSDGKFFIQDYDSIGKIESIFIYSVETGKDTTLNYKTPEVKAAFSDTVLQMIYEMRNRVIFPGVKNNN